MNPNVLAFRLRPGEDLRLAIEAQARSARIRAGCIVTCVGSLVCAKLRFADSDAVSSIDGPLEIVSLVGTLADNGAHLHLAVADREGAMRGGHLLAGSIVRTTAEIVIGRVVGSRFHRAHDPATGFRELEIGRRRLR